MKEQPTTHSAVRYLRDHYVELLAVLTVLFVLQTGLVPFDFGSRVGGGHGSLFSIRVNRLTLPDVISNIFLYFPLGVFAHWSLCRAAGSGRLVFLATVALAAALSGSVEWVQAYSPSRVSSGIDLVSNSVGASLGASVSTLARWVVPRLVVAATREFRERPLPSTLRAYALALVVVGAVPFSFSLDRVRLKESVQAVNLIPFAAPAGDVTYGFNGPQVTEPDHLRWERMKRWSRWTAECVSFGVLAWLLVLVLRSYYGFGLCSTSVLTGWIGIGFAIALSLMQLPIVSRACDVTDVLFRVMGLGLGCVCLAWYRRRTEGLSRSRLARVHREFAVFACAAVGVYIVYTGLIPMRFNLDLGGPGRSLSSDGFLPFFAYYFARFDVMMGDALEKLLSYVLLAATLSSCWPPVRHSDVSSRLIRVTGVCLVISVSIEMAQMFIDVRVTSLTDPILTVAGAVIGGLGQQIAANFYQFATTKDDFVTASAPLSSTDVLVGSLMDPVADAPVETVPIPSLQRTHD